MKSTSNQIAISAQKDFLERLSAASSINALAELIWNGLDAGSNQVDVEYSLNKLEGFDEIRIKDQGTGIPHGKVQELFGNLGSSWKRQRGRLNGRALHGKSGQGRFKAFALGDHVTWKTTFQSGEDRFAYQISGRYSALDSLTFTNTESAKASATGTEVIVSEIQKSHGSLLSSEAPDELAKLFAAYL